MALSALHEIETIKDNRCGNNRKRIIVLVENQRSDKDKDKDADNNYKKEKRKQSAHHRAQKGMDMNTKAVTSQQKE